MKLCYLIGSNRHIGQLHFQKVHLTQNIKVAFVGHHLDQVIGRLEASAGKYLVREKNQLCSPSVKKKKGKSFETFIKRSHSCQSRCSSNVKKKERKFSNFSKSKRSQLLPIKVLHFSPSVLVLKYNLVPILFPPCRDPLLQRNQRDPVKK